jgi:hypothetical protein
MKQKADSSKINKTDRLLANVTKIKREKMQISKIRNTKGEIKQTRWNSRESSESTLKNYIPINLTILKKQTNF